MSHQSVIRNTILSLLLGVMAFLPAESLAQTTPQVFCPESTSEWTPTGEPGFTFRCIDALGSRALIIQFKRGNALMYSVARQCPDLTRTFTLFWTSGTANMIGISCAGTGIVEPVRPWLPYFEKAEIKLI